MLSLGSMVIYDSGLYSRLPGYHSVLVPQLHAVSAPKFNWIMVANMHLNLYWANCTNPI